jgi:hemoglobin
LATHRGAINRRNPHSAAKTNGTRTSAALEITATKDSTMTDAQTETLYTAIGGDGTVRALTHRFYELMDTLPEAARCRAVHPADLSGSEEKFYEYLTGWLGGPPLYTDKRGHPRLRSRHFGAAIGSQERDEWLLCFNQALEETVSHPQLRSIILEPVTRLAHHMQNKDE